MLSESTFANCSETTSFNVASPSPSNVKAVRWGRAASNRSGFEAERIVTPSMRALGSRYR